LNDITLFAFIILLIIGTVGLSTCVEFYRKKQDSREIYLVVAWSMIVLRNIFIIYVLIADIVTENMFLITIIGVVQYCFLDIMGITRYYREINEKKAFLSLGIYVIFNVSISFIAGTNLASGINNIIVLGIQVYMVIAPIINLGEFKRKIGTSAKWYYITFISGISLIPITIYTNSLGYAWGVHDAENSFIICLFHIPNIIAHIFLILFTVHLEYLSINKKKDDLKDKYSHNLGNILQVLFGIEYFIKNNVNINEIEDSMGLFKNKLEEASKLIKEIRKL
jgi:hypothetical protein